MKHAILCSAVFATLMNCCVVKNANAVLGEEDRNAIPYVVTNSKLHEYKELWEYSKAHGRQNIYNNLSIFTKLTVVTMNAFVGTLGFLDVSDNEYVKINNVYTFLSVASLIGVSLDGFFFQRKSLVYAEAPEKLHTFLTKEADLFMQNKTTLTPADKYEVIRTLEVAFEARRREAAGEHGPLLQGHVQNEHV